MIDLDENKQDIINKVFDQIEQVNTNNNKSIVYILNVISYISHFHVTIDHCRKYIYRMAQTPKNAKIDSMRNSKSNDSKGMNEMNVESTNVSNKQVE